MQLKKNQTRKEGCGDRLAGCGPPCVWGGTEASVMLLTIWGCRRRGEGRSRKRATLQTWGELQKEVITPESKFFQSLAPAGCSTEQRCLRAPMGKVT